MLGVSRSACSESYSNVFCTVVRKKVILAGLRLQVCRKGELGIQTPLFSDEKEVLTQVPSDLVFAPNLAESEQRGRT